MKIDPGPYADFIVNRLLKRLPDFPASPRAVAETANAIEGDDWYWADDNAKVLELLALRSIWSRHPGAVTDIIKFVIGMCDGPLIFRRLAAPRLDIEENEDGRGRFKHSLMNISCDLKHGDVTLGMRFHDGRTARNAKFGGSSVTFNHGGKTYTVASDEHIKHYAIMPFEGGVKLVWKANLEFKPGMFSRRRTLGELTYTCTILASSMFVDFDAMLNIAPSAEVSDVILTFTSADVSHNDNETRYEALSALGTDRKAWRLDAAAPGPFNHPLSSATYWSIFQTSRQDGFAGAIHSLPGDPSRVIALNGERDRHGRIARVASHHMFKGPQSGRLEARERKVITSGGFYRDTKLYAETIARQGRASDAGGPPIDLSISYDYGAEINAFAKAIRSLEADPPPISRSKAKVLHDELMKIYNTLSDAYDHYFIKPGRDNQSAMFSRALAYLAFSQDEMAATLDGQRYLDPLRKTCDMIIRFERINEGVDGVPQSGFVMGTEIDALPYVDCHAACLLALIRGSTTLRIDDWMDGIDRGLAAFCLDTQAVGAARADLVCVDFRDPRGHRHKLETYWNFKAGLCLQLFNALESSRNRDIQRVWSKHRTRIQTLERILLERIERSTRVHDDGIEILTSTGSEETNSETQPWVAIGLMGDWDAAQEALSAARQEAQHFRGYRTGPETPLLPAAALVPPSPWLPRP